MSEPQEPKPAPEPQPETLKALSTPWWKQRTFYASFLAFMAAAPVLVDIFVPFLTPEQGAKLTAAAAGLASLAAVFARSGGVSAAAKVLEKAEGIPPVDPSDPDRVADALHREGGLR